VLEVEVSLEVTDAETSAVRGLYVYTWHFE
jgi:hypothetical protein